MPLKKRLEILLQPDQLDLVFSGIARFFVLALLVIHPLTITSRTYYNITKTKLISFRIIFSVFMGALLLLALYAYWRTGSRKPKGQIQLRPYEWALLAYWIAMLIATLFAVYPKEAWLGSSLRNEGFLMQTAYLLTCIVIGRLYRPRQEDFLFFCIVAALVAGYGIFQFYGLDFLHFLPPQVADNKGTKLIYYSTMSNRNVLSTYLCLAFSIGTVSFCRIESPIRWGFLPTTLTVFYMLMAGNTEGGYLGLLFAFALAFPFLTDSRTHSFRLFSLLSGCMILLSIFGRTLEAFDWKAALRGMAPFGLPMAVVFLVLALVSRFAPLPSLSPKAYRIGWCIFLIIVLVAGSIILPLLAEITGSRALREAAAMLEGEFNDNFGSYRMFIWKRTITLIKERPIFGHGPDNFYPVFSDHFAEESWEKHGQDYDKAHNEYLQVWFDSGLLGLLSLLAFYLLAIWGARKRLGEPLPLALALAMLGFLGQAFFNFSTPFVHPIIWAIWGILAGMGDFPSIAKGKDKDLSVPPSIRSAYHPRWI